MRRAHLSEWRWKIIEIEARLQKFLPRRKLLREKPDRPRPLDIPCPVVEEERFARCYSKSTYRVQVDRWLWFYSAEFV